MELLSMASAWIREQLGDQYHHHHHHHHSLLKALIFKIQLET
jgi:hypothetical protein